MICRVLRSNSQFKWYPHREKALVDRVVSTPTWPVPYYQRLFKAYPVREDKPYQLDQPDYPICNYDWYSTRMVLSQSAEGRAIMEYTENKIDTNNRIVEMNDCSSMARAYTQDLLGYLDLANQENKRILQDDLL